MVSLKMVSEWWRRSQYPTIGTATMETHMDIKIETRIETQRPTQRSCRERDTCFGEFSRRCGVSIYITTCLSLDSDLLKPSRLQWREVVTCQNDTVHSQSCYKTSWERVYVDLQYKNKFDSCVAPVPLENDVPEWRLGGSRRYPRFEWLLPFEGATVAPWMVRDRMSPEHVFSSITQLFLLKIQKIQVLIPTPWCFIRSIVRMAYPPDFFSKNERRATFYERRSVCRYQRHFITYSLYFIWSVYYESFCERQSWVFSSGMLSWLLL
jgi:hypothetical protein